MSGRLKRSSGEVWGGNGAYLLTSDSRSKNAHPKNVRSKGSAFVDLANNGTYAGAFDLSAWNLRTGRVHAIKGVDDPHSQLTSTVAAVFAANGRRLAVCLNDVVSGGDYPNRGVSVYDLPSGRCVAGYTFIEKADGVPYLLDMALSPNGRLLAVTDHEGVLTLWRVPR